MAVRRQRRTRPFLSASWHGYDNHVANTTDPETGRRIVTNLPLLLIDDEADNASVDTNEMCGTRTESPTRTTADSHQSGHPENLCELLSFCLCRIHGNSVCQHFH